MVCSFSFPPFAKLIIPKLFKQNTIFSRKVLRTSISAWGSLDPGGSDEFLRLKDVVFVLKIIETDGRKDCNQYQKATPCFRRKRSSCPLYKYCEIRRQDAIEKDEEDTDLDCSNDLAYEAALIEIKRIEKEYPILLFEAKIIMSNE